MVAELERVARADQQRAQELSTVARSLCVKCWEARRLDAELRMALNDCLQILGAVGVIAHFVAEQVTLHHYTAGQQPNEASRLEITGYLQSHLGPADRAARVGAVQDIGGFHVVGRVLSAASAQQPLGYCALIYRVDPHAERHAQEKRDTFHQNSTVGLIFQVLQHRVRVFSPFAPRVAEKYWEESLAPSPERLQPPWEHTSSLWTATLSIDLRKSTFCMDNAAYPARFAQWLDELVQILTAVTHLHGGVFDKFTGDGALVHFLERESRLVYGSDPVVAALDCAVSMHRAVARHLENLRTFLRLDSELLGAAVGIDVADTFWSVDHRNNPITVGRGVVNACRLGDKTEAGATRVTNIAYQSLERSRDLAEFVRVPFASKEYPREMRLTAWELPRGAHPLVRLATQTDAIVDAVYAGQPQHRAG